MVKFGSMHIQQYLLSDHGAPSGGVWLPLLGFHPKLALLSNPEVDVK